MNLIMAALPFEKSYRENCSKLHNRTGNDEIKIMKIQKMSIETQITIWYRAPCRW